MRVGAAASAPEFGGETERRGAGAEYADREGESTAHKSRKEVSHLTNPPDGEH